MGLSAGTDARANLLIAPKFITNHSAPDKYFLLLLPGGDISTVGRSVLAAGEGGLCPRAPRVAARAGRGCRAPALPGGNTLRGFSCGTPGSVPAGLKRTTGGHDFGCCVGPCC